MELTTAKCPECGAELKIPEGKDIITCDYCGANVIVKDLIGTGNNIDNFRSLANSALQGGSFQEAYDYYNKVLELNDTDPDAWLGKALCAGSLSGLSDIRFDEMLVLIDNAVNYTAQDEQDNMKKKAAVEINRIVMTVLNNIKNGRNIIFNPLKTGGFSVEFGNMLANAKRLAEESMKALQKAHELMPENKDISDNISDLDKQMKKTGSFIDTKDLNIHSGVSTARDTGISAKKSSYGFLKFIFLIVLIIGGYMVVKNYTNKDKPISKLINELSGKKNNDYTIENSISQNGIAYVSVYTTLNTDDALLKMNKEMIDKSVSKDKIIYFNYYSDRNSAAKNTALQSKHNKDWIIKNASSLNLMATLEYDAVKHSSKFYKYIDGKAVDIEQPQN